MIKKLILLVLFSLSATSLTAQDFFEQQAIDAVKKFLNCVRNNETISYEEEKSHFSDMLCSATLYIQADIMRPDGQWREKEPKDSLLGKLLISKREMFTFSENSRFFFYKTSELSGYVAVVTFVSRKDDMDYLVSEPISYTMLFRILNFRGIRIDLWSSSINGQSLPFLLGYEVKIKKVKYPRGIVDVKIPYFPDDKLKVLLKGYEK